jgi:RimJ/RimL family protein N-acetyltransferase
MLLRQMTMEDADKMLEWKNYPETIRFSIVTEEEITREAHYKWLENNIQYFHIIMDGEEMIGAIRFQDYEVSIWIDRKFWKQGKATYILQTFCKKGMKAKIVEGNVGSMVAFIRAGFEPVDYNYEGCYYTFKKY